MDNRKMLKISGICLLVESIISSIAIFITNFVQKDEVINQLSEQLQSLNINTETISNVFFITIIIGIVFNLIIQLLISTKAINHANGKNKKAGYVIIALILAILGASSLTNIPENMTAVNLVTIIFNVISILLYLSVYYFGRKVKKETGENVGN